MTLHLCGGPPPGELHGGRDPWADEQEEEYPEHVRDSPRGSWQIDSYGFSRVQGRHHCRRQGRGDEIYGHSQGRAGTLHHHQVHVSRVFFLAAMLDEVLCGYLGFLLWCGTGILRYTLWWTPTFSIAVDVSSDYVPILEIAWHSDDSGLALTALGFTAFSCGVGACRFLWWASWSPTERKGMQSLHGVLESFWIWKCHFPDIETLKFPNFR